MPYFKLRFPSWLWVLLILGIAIIVAFLLIASRPTIQSKPVVRQPPAITVQRIQLQPVQLKVYSQGNVTAPRRIELVSEVTGRITWVSEQFVNGKLVTEDTLLLKIDDINYRVALAEAEVQLRQSELNLAEEKVRAKQAEKNWRLVSKKKASDLTLRKPQLAQAEARLKAAHTQVEQAQLNLNRTKIKAPFTGILTQKMVDLGQYITVGTPLITLSGVTQAEIRLPILMQDLAYLQPIKKDGRRQVLLTQDGEHQWLGYLSHLEAQVDDLTRLSYAVVYVDNPYSITQQGQVSQLPLRLGQFVKATIEGKVLPAAAVIPRGSVHNNNTVYVVNQQGQLQRRQVHVAQLDHEYAIIDHGLKNDEQVILTQLVVVQDSMPVNIIEHRDTPSLKQNFQLKVN